MQRDTKLGYGFLLVGLGAAYLLSLFVGTVTGVVVAIACLLIGIPFLISGHLHSDKTVNQGELRKRTIQIFVPVLELLAVAIGISFVSWSVSSLSPDALKVPTLHTKYQPPRGPKIDKTPGAPPSKPKPELPQNTAPNVIPPLRGTEQFVTYVVWFPAESRILCPNNMEPIRKSICLDVRDFAKGHVNQDVFSSVGAILQRYFVALVWSAGQGWGYSAGPVNGHWSEINILPFEPPEIIHYVPSQLVDVSHDFYPFWFLLAANEKRMKLPKDTTISFFVEPSQEHRDSYITRFERKGYYQLDLSAYGYGAPEIGVVPEGYEIQSMINITQVTTYRFVLKADWVLQRSQAPSFVVEDYDRWAKELFANIRQKLAN